jgi:hypothetical protein
MDMESPMSSTRGKPGTSCIGARMGLAAFFASGFVDWA